MRLIHGVEKGVAQTRFFLDLLEKISHLLMIFCCEKQCVLGYPLLLLNQCIGSCESPQSLELTLNARPQA